LLDQDYFDNRATIKMDDITKNTSLFPENVKYVRGTLMEIIDQTKIRVKLINQSSLSEDLENIETTIGKLISFFS